MCAKLEPAKPRVTVRRGPRQTNNLAQLSGSMYSRTLDSFDAVTDAGRTSLIQGYASVIWQNNFLWSSGFIDDQAYQDVRVVADIFAALAAVSDVTSIFTGSSPFAPTLRTWVEAPKRKSQPSSKDKGDGDDDDELVDAINLAKLAELAPAIAGALG